MRIADPKIQVFNPDTIIDRKVDIDPTTVNFLIIDNPKLKKNNRYLYELSLNFLDFAAESYQLLGGEYFLHRDEIKTEKYIEYKIGTFISPHEILTNNLYNKNLDHYQISDDNFYRLIKNNTYQKVHTQATEPLLVNLYDSNIPFVTNKFDHLITPANGLNIINFSHENLKTITVIDVNSEAIIFTKNLLLNWNLREDYETFVSSMSNKVHLYNDSGGYSDNNVYFKKICDRNTKEKFFNVMNKIRGKEIEITFVGPSTNIGGDIRLLDYELLSRKNTLLYISNILCWDKTIHETSYIQKDLLFHKLLYNLGDGSAILGKIPYQHNCAYLKDDFKIEPSSYLNTPWRKQLYKNFYLPEIKRLV